MSKNTEKTNLIELIQELKKVKGALPYDGDASTQVLLPTINDKYLRVGITDDDIAEQPREIWFDYYEGLNNEIKRAWLVNEIKYERNKI